MLRKFARSLKILIPALLVLSTPIALLDARDDLPPVLKYADWKTVDSWSAEATATDHEWAKDTIADRWEDNNRVISVRYQFELKSTPPTGSTRRNSATWVVESCQARGDFDTHSRGGAFLYRGNHNYSGQFSGPVIKGGLLTIHFDTGAWQIVTPGKLVNKFTETGHDYVFLNGKVTNDNDGIVTEDRIPGILINGNLDAAVKPGVLTGHAINDKPTPGRPGVGSVREYHVTMWPNYRDVECVVEIDKYQDWLPAANITLPKMPGSRLHVNAYIRPKDGGPPVQLHARQFRFELSHTSHEPGVAMNYPSLTNDAEKAPPVDDPHADIRLALADTTGDVLEDGQTVKAKPFTNLRGQDSASVFADAFDFGGYSDLQVFCELEDGREIPGILHGKEGPVVSITLPKRSGGSKIADTWRQKYKLGLDDAEDNDQNPKGDGSPGDGYSNYEEYRGFVINGKHIRTDPNTKDLFIRNTLGSVADFGLFLFQQDTELKTHFRCTAGDMPPSRIMNSNRSARSPKTSQEYQHGLVLVWQRTGDVSFANVTNALWRPKYVQDVRILRRVARPNGNSHLTKEQDKYLAATIAHELCHSIGVKHHGDRDLRTVVWIRQSRKVDGNVEWWFEERKGEWKESTLTYSPSSIPGSVVRIYSNPQTEILASHPGKWHFPASAWVGIYGGEHSGSDKCVMRYDCANAYIIPIEPFVRYLSPGEPTGMELCPTEVGTGINDPSLDPPRYGNAVNGKCKFSFAVRDDAP